MINTASLHPTCSIWNNPKANTYSKYIMGIDWAVSSLTQLAHSCWMDARHVWKTTEKGDFSDKIISKAFWKLFVTSLSWQLFSHFKTIISLHRMTKKPKYFGGAGYRSRYLSHAKRALYHLSYAPSLECILYVQHALAGRQQCKLVLKDTFHCSAVSHDI